MQVAIVGCGPLGRERAKVLGGDQLVAVSDRRLERAVALAGEYANCAVEADSIHCATRADIDAVLLADDATAAIANAAAKAGKHLLIERPAVFSIQELLNVLALAERNHLVVLAGFRHRHHAAFQAASDLVKSGKLGPLYYVRGRLGNEREGNRDIVDDYLHLIDLARWFLGDFSTVHGRIGTCFWDMSFDDNGFVYLSTAAGRAAWLHVDATDWLNPFHFEIFGRDGKLEIDGSTTLRWHSSQRGSTAWELPSVDRSRELEVEHFQDCIWHGRAPMGSLADAMAALRIVRDLERMEPAPSWNARRAA